LRESLEQDADPARRNTEMSRKKSTAVAEQQPTAVADKEPNVDKPAL
jgi:hypothetical protein